MSVIHPGKEATIIKTAGKASSIKKVKLQSAIVGVICNQASIRLRNQELKMQKVNPAGFSREMECPGCGTKQKVYTKSLSGTGKKCVECGLVFEYDGKGGLQLRKYGQN